MKAVDIYYSYWLFDIERDIKHQKQQYSVSSNSLFINV